jgi:hypothetical protein
LLPQSAEIYLRWRHHRLHLRLKFNHHRPKKQGNGAMKQNFLETSRRTAIYCSPLALLLPSYAAIENIALNIDSGYAIVRLTHLDTTSAAGG